MNFKPTAIVIVSGGVAETIYAPPDFGVQIIDLDNAEEDGTIAEAEGRIKAQIDFQISQESFYTLKHFH